MTDGIIQEVFKKYYEHINSFNGFINFTDREVMGFYNQILTELIEKIKQIPIEDYFYHHKPNHWSCSSKCNLNIIKTLIGDNE